MRCNGGMEGRGGGKGGARRGGNLERSIVRDAHMYGFELSTVDLEVLSSMPELLRLCVAEEGNSHRDLISTRYLGSIRSLPHDRFTRLSCTESAIKFLLQLLFFIDVHRGDAQESHGDVGLFGPVGSISFVPFAL